MNFISKIMRIFENDWHGENAVLSLESCSGETRMINLTCLYRILTWQIYDMFPSLTGRGGSGGRGFRGGGGRGRY